MSPATAAASASTPERRRARRRAGRQRRCGRIVGGERGEHRYTCSSSPTDAGKPDISYIGTWNRGCTNTKPAGIDDTGKIWYQSVKAGTTIKWGTVVTYKYYPCTT